MQQTITKGRILNNYDKQLIAYATQVQQDNHKNSLHDGFEIISFICQLCHIK